MPSTYSPELRLELIATGEQSGVWGNTTNTNLGTLIEQAVAGVASITMTDANYTLVAASGILDEARNAAVNMVGTLTANRNVIVPTSTKLYVFTNSTTGGYAITVKTSGGTGVAIPNGYTVWLYCDGTNVKLATPDFNATTGDMIVPGALTIGSNATVGGNLAVTGSLSFGGSGGLVPPGALMPYAGSSAPSGWLLAAGQAVSRTTYSGLFAALGTTYGAGDGSTTFNLPDLRGRTPFGQDNMGGSAANRITNAVSGITGTTLGAAGGDQNIPTHTHTVTDPGHTHSHSDPGHTHTGTTASGGSHQHGVAGNNSSTYGISNQGNYGNTNNYVLTGTGDNLFNTAIAGAHTHTFTTDSATTSITNVANTTGITIASAGTGTGANVPPAIILNYIIKT